MCFHFRLLHFFFAITCIVIELDWCISCIQREKSSNIACLCVHFPIIIALVYTIYVCHFCIVLCIMRDQMNEATTGSNPLSLCMAASSHIPGLLSSSSASTSLLIASTIPQSGHSSYPSTSTSTAIAAVPITITSTPTLATFPNPPLRPPSSSTTTISGILNSNDPIASVTIRIKPKYMGRILENIEKITALFGVQYIANPTDCNHHSVVADDERGYKSLLFQCATTVPTTVQTATTTIATATTTTTATAATKATTVDNDIADLCTSLQVKISNYTLHPCRECRCVCV